jgi:hypothetical protein
MVVQSFEIAVYLYRGFIDRSRLLDELGFEEVPAYTAVVIGQGFIDVTVPRLVDFLNNFFSVAENTLLEF